MDNNKDKYGSVKQKEGEEAKNLDYVLAYFAHNSEETCASYLKLRGESNETLSVSKDALVSMFQSYFSSSKRQTWDYMYTYIPGIKNNSAFVSRYSQKDDKYETLTSVSKFKSYQKTAEPVTTGSRLPPVSSTSLASELPVPGKTMQAEVRTKNAVIFDKCHSILRALVHFLHNTIGLNVQTLEIELFKDLLGNLWLVGARNLRLETRSVGSKAEAQPYKCPGQYCDVVWNGLMFIGAQGDAKETQRIDYWSCVPLGTQRSPEKSAKKSSSSNKGKNMFPSLDSSAPGKRHQIELKSMLLNKEELAAYSNAATKPSHNGHRQSLIRTDPLLLSMRKYMTLANILMNFPQYRHLRLSNLSKKVEVCSSCYRAYSTIDKARQRYFEKLEKATHRKSLKRRFSRPMGSLVPAIILPSPGTDQPKSTIISPAISARGLAMTQGREPKPSGELGSFGSISGEITERAESESESIVVPHIHSDLTTKKKFILEPESELFGLKFSLGHTYNLSREDVLKKSFLTRSSIGLNQLNDLHKLGDTIEKKLEILSSQEQDPDVTTLKCQWIEKRQLEIAGRHHRKNSHGKEDSFASSQMTPTSVTKKVNIKMLANQDDVAAIDRNKAMRIEAKHRAKRQYYQIRDAPQLEPEIVPMCALAESVLPRPAPAPASSKLSVGFAPKPLNQLLP